MGLGLPDLKRARRDGIPTSGPLLEPPSRALQQKKELSLMAFPLSRPGRQVEPGAGDASGVVLIAFP